MMVTRREKPSLCCDNAEVNEAEILIDVVIMGLTLCMTSEFLAGRERFFVKCQDLFFNIYST